MQSGIQMKEQGAAPPPYSGYPPSQPAVASQPVVVGAAVAYPAAAVVPAVVPAVVVGNPMGTSPTIYICKSCNNQIITKVERRPSMRTHLFALLLCVFGCWPCACLPYCIDSCNNADHYCPHCNSYIGSYIG